VQGRRSSNVRPTYLLVEPDSDGVSSRKLVLETILKHNVLVANSADEAQTTLHVFPNVDGVIVHSDVPDAQTLCSWIRKEYPEKYILFLAEPTRESCAEADAVISGHSPAEFLDALQVDYDTSGATDRRATLLDDLARTLRKPQRRAR